MDNIKKLINRFFIINEKEKPEREYEIYNAWKKTVEEKIFLNSEIIKTEKQKIYIKANNPILRNEISFKKNNIIKLINKKIKTTKIKEIIIR